MRRPDYWHDYPGQSGGVAMVAARDELKAAEKRGYAKGYAAGKKAAAEDARKKFWRDAFLTALPIALSDLRGFRNDVCLDSTYPYQVKVAGQIADAAVIAAERS